MITMVATPETKLICQTFVEYGEAFKTLNPFKILSYYEFPALLIEAGSKSRALPARPFGWFVGLALFAIAVLKLRSQSYSHSCFTQLSVQYLSDDLTLISGQATRFRKDDTVLKQFGFLYTMRKTARGWKIIVGTIHDLDKSLGLENHCPIED
ncbi:MAG: hypothetical protein DCF22_14090 [Leptolyngbya sp.]|nr:MAG: hypothetical protein DCF22_14090 [Leptolyngbya sp.]